MSINAGESGTDQGRMKEQPPQQQNLDQQKQKEEQYSELQKETGAGVQVSKDQSQQPIKKPDAH